MYIVHVHIHVKSEFIDAFKAASLENAEKSIREPGVARFDVLQQPDDPARFVLVEIYRTSEDPAKHKATAHYNRWREAVEPMMARSRTSTVFINLFPADKDY
jgi:(4S)-4-hydroxy-5-phosphonooxypentane-2,3-dione isomerase